jgi:hypothetical protein
MRPHNLWVITCVSGEYKLQPSVRRMKGQVAHLTSHEDGSKSSIWNVVFYSYLELRTMGKVHRPSDSKDIPSMRPVTNIRTPKSNTINFTESDRRKIVENILNQKRDSPKANTDVKITVRVPVSYMPTVPLIAYTFPIAGHQQSVNQLPMLTDFYPKYGSYMLLRNVCSYKPHTVSHPRRRHSS